MSSPSLSSPSLGSGTMPPASGSIASSEGNGSASGLVTSGVPFSPLQDRIAAILAVAISAIALTMLVLTFWNSADKKDTLMLALSLLGTVTGYYFGRTPGELSARVSQANAENANRVATSATAASAETARGLATAQREVEQTRARARDTLRQALALLPNQEGDQSRAAGSGGQVDEARRVLTAGIRSFD